MKLNETKQEFKKIKWPSRKDVCKRLLVVIGGIVVVGCLTLLIDTGTQLLLSLLP